MEKNRAEERTERRGMQEDRRARGGATYMNEK